MKLQYLLTNDKNLLAILILSLIAIVSGVLWVTSSRDRVLVSSPALKAHQQLDIKYTCAGENINPPFELTKLPKNAQTLAIIVEDLDIDPAIKSQTPNHAHWIVWNIPPTVTKVVEGVRPPGTVGRNVFGHFNYAGPCPPEGQTHRYTFRFIAVSQKLTDVTPENSFAEIKAAIEKNLLTEWSTNTTYTRPKK